MPSERAESESVIYHIFADTGIESEFLSAYGRVIRLGLDPEDTNDSEPVAGDALHLPLKEGADLAVLHPPCQKWSPIANDPDSYPNIIPEAREIGERYADHYIIENVPRAPLRDPVRLKGDMFGLPINYERAFETSFHVEQPAIYRTFENESGVNGRRHKSREWWKAAKGVVGTYPKDTLVNAGIPGPYIHYLMRAWLRATGLEVASVRRAEVPA